MCRYSKHSHSSPHNYFTAFYFPIASAARFCCIACCSANRKPTRCVILIYLSAQCSTQAVSFLSRDLERKEETHDPKHRSTSVLYMLRCRCLCQAVVCVFHQVKWGRIQRDKKRDENESKQIPITSLKKYKQNANRTEYVHSTVISQHAIAPER